MACQKKSIPQQTGGTGQMSKGPFRGFSAGVNNFLKIMTHIVHYSTRPHLLRFMIVAVAAEGACITRLWKRAKIT